MKIVIVGAGLSGLMCARQCLKELSSFPNVKITVVEARDRLGGRLHAENGIDLGAAWSWVFNDRYLQTLAKELNVGLEPQLTQGKSLMQGYNGATRTGGEESPSGDGSTRFRGSAASIVKALTAELGSNPQVEFLTNSAVTSISSVSGSCRLDAEINIDIKTNIPSADLLPDGITMAAVSSTINSIQASAVVLAMPPQLIAADIAFNPPLSANKRRAMEETPTWMYQAGKVSFTYNRRFWYEDRGLSGTAFSESGPMVQVWDSSSASDSSSSSNGEVGGEGTSRAALAGFVFDDDLKYLKDEATLRASPIMTQLVQLFGPDAAYPTGIAFKSWMHDPYTTVQQIGVTGEEVNHRRQNPGSIGFGHPYVCEPHQGRIFFAGTEAAKGKSIPCICY